MSSFFSKVLTLTLISILIVPTVSASHLRTQNKKIVRPTYISQPSPYQYQGVTSTTLTCSNFSNASVGVGTLSNGVIVTIDSPDYILSNCIKNTSWLSYFTRFGNGVTISVSNTTRGVQITAVGNDISTISNLQNTAWQDLINGSSMSTPTYTNPVYTTTYNTNNNGGYYNAQGYYVYPSTYSNGYGSTQAYYVNSTSPSIYIQPNNTIYARSYIPGSSIFPNTSQTYRALTYIPSGVKITLSSADYNTMRFLQGYSYVGLFREFTGISLSTVNISGGVEVTITGGSASTIEQIQKIGYALVYQ